MLRWTVTQILSHLYEPFSRLGAKYFLICFCLTGCRGDFSSRTASLNLNS